MARIEFPAPVKGVRGSDRKKQERNWVDVQRVHEFDDGHYIGYVGNAEDTATLGKLMGHCSGTHFIWTVEERIWYFFAIFDKNDVPHGTIHAKQASWVGKTHPRDRCPRFPAQVANSQYGYPSLADTIANFKKVGLEYEAGKYSPPQYDSCTYDDLMHGGGYDPLVYRYRYGNPVVPGRKPAEVDTKLWDAYVAAAKAVTDNHDQAIGAVKVNGRRFKFDGKWLVIISATNKSQDAVRGTYPRMVAEWLNNANKKEKK